MSIEKMSIEEVIKLLRSEPETPHDSALNEVLMDFVDKGWQAAVLKQCLLDWLTELIELRKQPKIIYCGDECANYKALITSEGEYFYYCNAAVCTHLRPNEDFCSRARPAGKRTIHHFDLDSDKGGKEKQ